MAGNSDSINSDLWYRLCLMSEYRGDHEVHGESPFVVWGAALLKEPDATLDRILSGVGGRGSQQRAEPDDFLADLLANPDHQEIRTQLTDHLDRALLRWIEVRSEWSPRCIVAFGPRAYAAQMADALAVAARLSLKTTAGELMRNHVVWDDRFHVLRRPGDIDLLREFDMVLALHQTDVRFVPRWFAACDEAAWGSPYWQTRLSTGFLGLRKLPTTSGTEPEMMQATALARFGALALSRGMKSDLVERTFRQRAAAMTTLYPRHVEYWRRLWAAVLADLRRPFDRHVAMLNSWLDDASGTAGARATERIMQPRASNLRAALPERWRLQWLEQDDLYETPHLDPALFGKVHELISDRWRYAFASGESHYAVRTTVNLCNRVLWYGVDESPVEQLHPWALQAVEAEPENSCTWEFAESELKSIYDNAGIRQDLGVWLAPGTERQTSLPWRSESGPAAYETGIVGDGSIVATYLSRLEYRTGLLERFFASSDNGTGEPRSAVAYDDGTSELALVAAHRAGLLDGADRRKKLHTWIEAHPSSYSVRLLLVWRGTKSSGPDSAALSAIEREFPEHREWNERLSYGFNSRDQHGGLPRKVIRDGPVPGSDSWASRLVAVYPSLKTQQDDAPARFDSAAWRRLMEDIAFAGAERALPSTAPGYEGSP